MIIIFLICIITIISMIVTFTIIILSYYQKKHQVYLIYYIILISWSLTLRLNQNLITTDSFLNIHANIISKKKDLHRFLNYSGDKKFQKMRYEKKPLNIFLMLFFI